MIALQILNGIDVTVQHFFSQRMGMGATGMRLLCFSVRHFVSSEKLLSLNSTSTQVRSSYGICLGPSLYL